MSRIKSNPAIVHGAQIFTTVVDISITANTNNLTIPNLEATSLIRISSTGNHNITGIVNPDGLARQIFIFNVGTNNILFKDNDAASTAANRFILGTDKTAQANEGVALVYDNITLRWRSYGLNI